MVRNARHISILSVTSRTSPGWANAIRRAEIPLISGIFYELRHDLREATSLSCTRGECADSSLMSRREPIEKTRRWSNDEKWIRTSCSARIVAFSSLKGKKDRSCTRTSGLVDTGELCEKPRPRDCHFLRGGINWAGIQNESTTPLIFLFNHLIRPRFWGSDTRLHMQILHSPRAESRAHDRSAGRSISISQSISMRQHLRILHWVFSYTSLRFTRFC